MQLMIGVGGSWKCVSVTLNDGCIPCIGGVPLSKEKIEPALWFKVAVLSTVFVDCSERIISWSLSEDDLRVSSIEWRAHTKPPLTLSDSHRSLMAPVEGAIDSLLCTNDLQNLFELAEVLYRVSMPTSAVSQSVGAALSESLSRTSLVEYKSWLRLLHCYLLPIVGLQVTDIEAVDEAHTQHLLILEALDNQLLQVTNELCHIKEKLAEMLNYISDRIAVWVENKQCSLEFISTVSSDLKLNEECLRRKILSAVKKLDLNEHVDSGHDSVMVDKLTKEKKDEEEKLRQSLMLRSHLEGVAALGDLCPCPEGETCDLQQSYMKLHHQLARLRESSATLCGKKVLSLSVREALEQSLTQLRKGQSTTGLDISFEGGHSTDVLPEASCYSASNEYLTLKDKVQKLIQIKSTALSKEHNSFCKTMKSTFNSQSEINTEERSHSVHHHFRKIVDLVCTHFNDHERDFMQKTHLCYEKIFFEMFIIDFLQLYQTKHAKYCEQLAINSLGASLIDPVNLDLGLKESWSKLFSARSFAEAHQLYKDIHCSPSDTATAPSCCSSLSQLFKGVLADLNQLSSAHSPLNQLQFLTSAFRKSMTALSDLKLKTLLEHSTLNQVDVSLATVSFDELLPVLVLILLQCTPNFLAKLHIHCTFLTDYMPPFLSPGWHGYSLAAFTSALHIISKL